MKLVAFTAILVFVAAPVARADTLTLAQAQAEARAHAPEVGLADATVRNANEIVSDRQRRIRSDPDLSVSYAREATIAGSGELAVGVGLQWKLDLSGAWRESRDAAIADRLSATTGRSDTLAAVDEAVAAAVAQLAYSQRQLKRSERIEALQRVSRDAAQKLVESGQGSQLDADAGELDLSAAIATRYQARAALEAAQLRLARLLGRSRFGDLVVDDPAEVVTSPSEAQMDSLVEADPRVQSAVGLVRSAELGHRAADRAGWSTITFGLDLDYARHEIPEGSFVGGSMLAANWTDWEIGARISVPLALFDRRREARTRASVIAVDARARLEVTRADVRSELLQASSVLRAATDVWTALEPTGQVINREYALLDKAFRAGALDVTQRAQSSRRLVEAGERLDAAVRDLRIARARWVRRSQLQMTL